jgi:hypothetical protein
MAEMTPMGEAGWKQAWKVCDTETKITMSSGEMLIREDITGDKRYILGMFPYNNNGQQTERRYNHVKSASHYEITGRLRTDYLIHGVRVHTYT